MSCCIPGTYVMRASSSRFLPLLSASRPTLPDRLCRVEKGDSSMARSRRPYNIIKAQVKAADRSCRKGRATGRPERERERLFFLRGTRIYFLRCVSTWRAATKTSVVAQNRCLIRQWSVHPAHVGAVSHKSERTSGHVWQWEMIFFTLCGIDQ